MSESKADELDIGLGGCDGEEEEILAAAEGTAEVASVFMVRCAAHVCWG